MCCALVHKPRHEEWIVNSWQWKRSCKRDLLVILGADTCIRRGIGSFKSNTRVVAASPRACRSRDLHQFAKEDDGFMDPDPINYWI